MDLGRGAVEERAKIRSVPRVAGRRRVARARDVAASQLERRDPELARDEVEMGLRPEHVLRLARRAHVAPGHVVRVHGGRLVARCGDAIPLERRDSAFDKEPHGRLARGVRAAVEERV